MRYAYIDASTGISGDLFAAALLDLTAKEETVRRNVEALNFSHLTLQVLKGEISDLPCTFYGSRDHEEEKRKAMHRGRMQTRSIREIRTLLNQAELSEGVLEHALAIYRILAEAEAVIHDEMPEEVHFHEVGSNESVADIVAIASLIQEVKADAWVIGKLCDGSGFVRCAHGRLAVPVPVVSLLTEMYNLPLETTEREGEWVTPTGAATLASLNRVSSLPEGLRKIGSGSGGGNRSCDVPNILRIDLYED